LAVSGGDLMEAKALFAARLKEARLKSGLTQKQAAEAVGVSERQWQLWESGKNCPSVIAARACADVVGASLDTLTRHEE